MIYLKSLWSICMNSTLCIIVCIYCVILCLVLHECSLSYFTLCLSITHTIDLFLSLYLLLSIILHVSFSFSFYSSSSSSHDMNLDGHIQSHSHSHSSKLDSRPSNIEKWRIFHLIIEITCPTSKLDKKYFWI